MDKIKTKFKESSHYPGFYKRYNRHRDRLIRKYLKYLKRKSSIPLTMANKNKVLKYRRRYERLAQAYWDTRLANRPFLIASERYVKRETPASRAAFRRHPTQTFYDPNAYKGGYP